MILQADVTSQRTAPKDSLGGSRIREKMGFSARACATLFQFMAFLLTSVFMTPAYGPGTPFGELKVTRRTGVLRRGPGRRGLVLGDVRKVACTDSAKEGHVFLSFREARHRTAPEH